MNECFEKQCPHGFAFHQKFLLQTDSSGSFRYNWTTNTTTCVECGRVINTVLHKTFFTKRATGQFVLMIRCFSILPATVWLVIHLESVTIQRHLSVVTREW